MASPPFARRNGAAQLQGTRRKGNGRCSAHASRLPAAARRSRRHGREGDVVGPSRIGEARRRGGRRIRREAPRTSRTTCFTRSYEQVAHRPQDAPPPIFLGGYLPSVLPPALEVREMVKRPIKQTLFVAALALPWLVRAPATRADYQWTREKDTAAFEGSYNFPVFVVRGEMWAFHPRGGWSS